MKYIGSKARVAKYIVPIIQAKIDESGAEAYLEPFVGGANMIQHINCKNRIGADAHPYLIALLKHVQGGGELPDEITKPLYDDARTCARLGNTEQYEDWMVGCVGFLASYNGRYFDGGYAGKVMTKTHVWRDYYDEAKRNLLQQAQELKGICFCHKDYRKWSPRNAVIYCDPPYQNRKQYSIAFDSEEFWQVMRRWSRDNIVLVSEENAPEDFTCIWEQEVTRTQNNAKRLKATEKLFIHGE